VVPSGGLSSDGDRWIAAREGFFLPVRVLSRLFREKYLAYLRQVHQASHLILTGRLDGLATTSAWETFIESLRRTEWVVYAKPPFGSPEQVLKYLARYTHRVAISNRRLVAIENGQVAFRYRDYRRGRRPRTMNLSTTEFTRRFLLHVLPRAFVRIRHYGLLANRSREQKLAHCRRLLAEASRSIPEPEAPAEKVVYPPHERCPACQSGHLVLIGRFPHIRAGPLAA
jgi:hypothetical protein